MNSVIGLGKYLYAVPMAVFGIMHFMAADQLAGMAPGGKIMVYFTGLALLAAGVSIAIGKFDKLAAVLLALMLLLFIIPHIQMMGNELLPQDMRDMQPGNILKNLALAGGALMYAHMAKDNSVIG